MRPFETLTHRGQVHRLRQLAVKALTAYALDEPRLTALIHEDNTTFHIDSADGDRFQAPGRICARAP